MNKNNIVIFIAYSMVAKLQPSKATNSPHLEVGFLQKTVDNVQLVTANVLTLINVNKHLWNTKKIQQLLTLHWHAQQIVKTNDEIYDDIGIASKTESSNETINPILNLTEIIDETFDLKQEYRKLNEFINNITLSSNVLNSYIKLDFLSYINGTILQLTSEDVVLINNTDVNKQRNITNPTRKSYNLKIWRPSNFTGEKHLFNQSRRIYRGKPVKLSKFPFMVSVHVMDEFLCGGSIISKDLVITAASCLQVAYKSRYERGNAKFLAVRVGSDYTLRFGELVPITDVYFHPLYQPAHLLNNLAIVRIDIRAPLRKKLRIRRIEYDRTERRLLDNKILMLGWGDKDEQVSGKFNSLSFARLDMYNVENCMEIYSREFVSEKNFCAGFVDVGDGACSHDVGGPAVIDAILVGVVSFGPPVCGTLGAPTVFTQIGYYTKWIESIKAKMPSLTLELITATDLEAVATSGLKTTKDYLRLGTTLNPKLSTTRSMGLLPKGIEFIKNFLRQLITPNQQLDRSLYGESKKEKNNLKTTIPELNSQESRTKDIEESSYLMPKGKLPNNVASTKTEDNGIIESIQRILQPLFFSRWGQGYRKTITIKPNNAKSVIDDKKIESPDTEEILSSSEVSDSRDSSESTENSGTNSYYSDEGISIDTDGTIDISSHEKYSV